MKFETQTTGEKIQRYEGATTSNIEHLLRENQGAAMVARQRKDERADIKGGVEESDLLSFLIG